MTKKIATTTRQEKVLQTNNKLRDSAEYLFKKYGYEDVSVDDIVALSMNGASVTLRLT